MQMFRRSEKSKGSKNYDNGIHASYHGNPNYFQVYSSIFPCLTTAKSKKFCKKASKLSGFLSFANNRFLYSVICFFEILGEMDKNSKLK